MEFDSDEQSSVRATLALTKLGSSLAAKQPGIESQTPEVFGLHPNAEIGYRTAASSLMFDTLISLQACRPGAKRPQSVRR